MKKICVIGATGLIGRELVKNLKSRGHQVMESSFRLNSNPDPAWESKIAESEVIVNLAGEPIFGRRWTDLIKSEIYDSRVDGTKKIVDAMKRAQEKFPGKSQALINASAIGFYGSRGEETLNEESEAGKDFLAFVVRDWEEAALSAQRTIGVRAVVLRTGVVLAAHGGALQKMLLPFRLGLGGPVNFGTQWFSWIHIADLVNAYVFAIENPISGVFNAVSPHAVRNKEYAKSLGRVLRRPAILPVPGIALRALFGEASEVLTAGQKCQAEKIMEAGFQFQYPHLEGALKNLLGR